VYIALAFKMHKTVKNVHTSGTSMSMSEGCWEKYTRASSRICAQDIQYIQHVSTSQQRQTSLHKIYYSKVKCSVSPTTNIVVVAIKMYVRIVREQRQKAISQTLEYDREV